MLNSTHANDASKIVKVLDGGVDFYQHGIEHVAKANVRAMFQRMVEEKQKAIAMMRPFIVQDTGNSHSNMDWYQEFTKCYAPLLDAAGDTSDVEYISHLEAVEEKVMDIVETTLNGVAHSEFATELRCIRTRMQQCRDEMQSLKEAVK